MKKSALLISIFCSLFLFSCYNPVLFNIRGDVKPEPAEICGTIQTITRYNVGGQEFLVIIAESNEDNTKNLYSKNTKKTNIYYKPVTSTKHGEWKIYNNSPVKEPHHYHYEESEHLGEQLILTHATSDTLYVFTTEYANDDSEGTSYPSKFHIYAKQITLAEDGSWSTDGEWVDILDDGTGYDYFPIYLKDSYFHSAFSVFSTNSVQNAHRKLYFRRGDINAKKDEYKSVTYYEISGLNAPVQVELTPSDSTEKNNINSAVYFNGAPMFFNTIASTTNETPDTDATMVYYAGESYIYYKSTEAAEFSKGKFKTGNPASTLCVCKDSLLIGRANYASQNQTAMGGIVKTSLDENGIIGSELTAFDTNAEIQLSSSYFILSLVNINPALTEQDSTLYATIDFFGSGTSTAVSYNNVGLWSYYPDRGNWNRE